MTMLLPAATRTAFILGTLVWAGAAAPPPPAAAPAPPRPPNIVFIMADDLGYGDLGCYGQKQVRTPQLDRLAAEGMRFTDFYAGSPVCAPSRNVLMTGQHSGHVQVRGNAKVNLRPEDVTVAQVLKGAGYTTGMLGKWGLGAEGSDATPTKKGFDYFYGYIDQTMAHNYYPTFLVRNDERVPLRNVVPEPGPYGQGVATVKLDYTHDLLAEDALKFLEARKAGPFFLYLAFTLPHANNEAEGNGMEVPDLAPYDNEPWPAPAKGFAAMVTRLDHDVGRVLAKLKELGLDESTLVIFTSDNGPQQPHEGGYEPDYFDSNGPLRGIKRDVYEGGLRVPFIARWPGHIASGTVSRHPAYLGDFMATAADLAKVQPPEKLDSVSFLPTLLGKPAEQRQHEYLYWEFYEAPSSQAVRMGDWKAVRIPMFTGPMQLYDLSKDLGEQTDVASQHPDIVTRATAAMQAAHVPNPLWRPQTGGRRGSGAAAETSVPAGPRATAPAIPPPPPAAP